MQTQKGVMPRLTPNDVRTGLQLLIVEATAEEREDIRTECERIVAMSDNELKARQYEIDGLRRLGLDPIEAGYLECGVGKS